MSGLVSAGGAALRVHRRRRRRRARVPERRVPRPRHPDGRRVPEGLPVAVRSPAGAEPRLVAHRHAGPPRTDRSGTARLPRLHAKPRRRRAPRPVLPRHPARRTASSISRSAARQAGTPRRAARPDEPARARLLSGERHRPADAIALEIAVCAQHNNGGLAGNVWWESNVGGPVPRRRGERVARRPEARRRVVERRSGRRAERGDAHREPAAQASPGGRSLRERGRTAGRRASLGAGAARCSTTPAGQRRERRRRAPRHPVADVARRRAHPAARDGPRRRLRTRLAHVPQPRRAAHGPPAPATCRTSFRNRDLCLAHAVYLTAITEYLERGGQQPWVVPRHGRGRRVGPESARARSSTATSSRCRSARDLDAAHRVGGDPADPRRRGVVRNGMEGAQGRNGVRLTQE
ncbi:MAG: hypothetical protein MZV64_43015 [Ignavibacteriales bacterium]|nr:hypothetical protein [Ignavibacteriales bacterium]